MKFKQKLFISYLVVCILPIIVLGYFSYYQANNFLIHQANRNLYDSITQISENINYKCMQYESIVNSITQNIVFKQVFTNNDSDISSTYRDYVDSTFNNVLEYNKDIIQLFVLTQNKKMHRWQYVFPMRLVNGLSQENITGSEKETVWYSRNKKLFCIRLFTPNYSYDDTKLPSILFMGVDVPSLFHGIDEINSNSYEALVVDKQGKNIFVKNKNMNVSFDENTIRQNNLTDKSGIFKSDRDYYIYVKKDIPETKWQVYYFTPKSSLSIDTSSILRVTALIIVICFAILLFISWMFSNTFVKRINRLNKKMQLVENGNLKLDVHSDSKDEIGELENRFGKMLNNINVLIDEVYQSKITQKEAELRALQTQINPHFLYNTLSIINWMAIQINAMEISKIVNAVSKFYRTVLNRGKNEILVQSEVDNAKAYMDIQLAMHNNSFDFICNVDQEMYQYSIINLVFQPILENALEHGIDKRKEKDYRGKVILSGYFIDDNLEFCIEDNGVGMDEESANDVLKVDSDGYGLKNVNSRIKIFFGNDYGIRLFSKPGNGTKVFITFPEKSRKEQKCHERNAGNL